MNTATFRLTGLVVTSGVLLALSYSLHPLWWTAWVAPAPAIAASLLAPPSLRYRLGLSSGLIAGASTFSYHLTVGGWAAAIIILALVALAWASAIRLAASTADRWSASAAILAVPLTWAAIDTLLIHFSPHGSAGSIAYSQMSVLPVIQVASLGGVPAVTFVVLLAGSLAGLLLARAFGARVRGLPVAAALTAMVVGSALLFGWVRLSHGPPAGRVSVAMLATDGIRTQPRDWRTFWNVYGRAIDRVARPETLVVLPEAVVRLNAVEAEKAGVMFATYALAHRATIVVGVVVTEGGRTTNRALVARSDGGLLWYVKQQLVPGFEAAMTPGDRPLVTSSPIPGIGVAICKDMHFPTLGRAYALDGARLMVVPANDFEVDDWMTARMTVLRGVENGLSIARAARHGISFVSDRYGHVLAERRSGPSLGIRVVGAPTGSYGLTVYAIAGDVFGWLCLVGWVGSLVVRRAKPS